MLNRASEEPLRQMSKRSKAGAGTSSPTITAVPNTRRYLPPQGSGATPKMLAGAGVDYIINSHPHVMQPFGKVKVNDTVYPVLYSMGNFVFRHDQITTPRETIILSLTLQRDEMARYRSKVKGIILATCSISMKTQSFSS